MAAPTIRSIAFPFKKGNFSFPQEAVDSDAIMASLIQIITTAKGERIMRPDFGCDAFSYVFESIDDDLKTTIERDVRMSIARWEPRVRVEGINIESDNVVEPGQLVISITYTILPTGQIGRVNIAGGS